MAEYISADQAFIKKLTGIVEANLGDENFNVKKLAREAGMSHSSLHRRLKAVKNQDVSEFINDIRLQRAMELLRLNAGSVSEIAYMTGFGSPSYFSRCFHDYYGYPPGEVKKRALAQPEPSEKTAGKGTSFTEEEMAVTVEKPSGRMKRIRRIVLITSVTAMTLCLLAWYRFIPEIKEYNRSIVVLPFKNLSEQPGNRFLADGIMEDILNDLCRIGELRVVSRTTSEYFRGKDMTAREVGRKVNARYILESSVRQTGEQTRITVQLIDGFCDRHLWSENFDRRITDIIDLQGSVATKVVHNLKDKIPVTASKEPDKNLTSSPEAYLNYLHGRFLLNNSDDEQRIDITREGLLTSIRYFEKAVAADSSFAEAYTGMAKAYMSLAGWGWIQPARDGFNKALELSNRALEINPDLAMAHAAKGSVLVWGKADFEGGRKELLLALRAYPPYPPVYQTQTQLMMITGPVGEARTYMDRALELEPYYWVLHNLSAWLFYYEEKHGKAIEACRIAQDLNPDYIFTNWLFFLNYAKNGQGEKAAEELQTILKKTPDAIKLAEEIPVAFQNAGVHGLFQWLIDVNKNRPVAAAGLSGHPFFIAWWNAILGNREETLSWLEKNLKARNRLYFYLNNITTNPDFDFIRNDPRFLAIVEELGLTPYNTRTAR